MNWCTSCASAGSRPRLETTDADKRREENRWTSLPGKSWPRFNSLDLGPVIDITGNIGKEVFNYAHL